MKGIIFKEFIEMVETKMSPDMADRVIDACDLPSGGAYTVVGTYDTDEIIQLVVQLSKETGIAVPDLIFEFGKYLFHRFPVHYPHFFGDQQTTFDLLDGLHGYIHKEVAKLYPDAQLPEIRFERVDEKHARLHYNSPRCLAGVAEGLLAGCIEHFGEPIEVRREDFGSEAGREACFHLSHRNAHV